METVTAPNIEREFYETESFWNRERYVGLPAERVMVAAGWIPPDVRSVLDVGCGNGLFTEQLSNMPVVVGTDRSRSALKHVQVPCCQADASSLPFPDNCFDMVTAMEVIEHLPFHALTPAIGEIARVARRYVLVTVPYRENLARYRVICPECGCQFNHNFHMRTFSRVRLERLFVCQPIPVSPIRIEGVLPALLPFTIEDVRRVLRLKPAFPWFAVCPQCGYRHAGGNSDCPATKSRTEHWLNQFKKAARRFWPVPGKHRWWMALYQKGA